MTALETRGVCASYGAVEVLTGVDLAVPQGSLTVLVGESGSGKTTLLRVLAGFERPTAGTVLIGGDIVDERTRFTAPQRRRLGWVAQDGALFPHLDVTANVGFGLSRSARRSATVAELIDMVGLGAYAERYPHQLSGGQQQRVALARALAVAPVAVLLDEPFSSLDPSLRTRIRDDVRAILRRAGTTALLVSHDRDEALSVADNIAVLRGGRIVASGSPGQLYATPPDPATAALLGDANLMRSAGPVDGDRVHTPFGPLRLHPGTGRLAPGTPMTVLVRPEQLVVGPPRSGVGGDPAVGDRSAMGDRSGGSTGEVEAAVTAVEYHGHNTVLRVAPCDPLPGPGPQQGELVVRVPGRSAVAPGDVVALSATGPVVAWPDRSD